MHKITHSLKLSIDYHQFEPIYKPRQVKLFQPLNFRERKVFMSGTMTKKTNSKQLLILLAIIEAIFITLFGFFVRYDEQWSDADTTRHWFYIFLAYDMPHIEITLKNYTL